METPLIIARIQGGLGNQMFQYATAVALTERNGGTLKLDINSFKNYEFHSYSLNKLSIDEKIASNNEIARFTQVERFPPIVRRVVRRTNLERVINSWYRYYREPGPRFWPEFEHITGDAYLDGYWLSDKYFKNIRPRLLSEFSCRDKFGEVSNQCANKISTTEQPVCIHIRRGDFANHPISSKTHGTCSLEYYHEAVRIICEQIQNPHFFVFSDSPDWAREHFRLDSPTDYFGQGADKNHEDLSLMRSCKHFVLSNSTFGWWAAWLSNGDGKIVVAPRRWMVKEFDTTDLLPTNWTVLDI